MGGRPGQPFLPPLRGTGADAFSARTGARRHLAAPVVALLLAIEVGIGTMNRLMPQLNAFALSMALRALVAATRPACSCPALMHAIATLAVRLLAPP